MALASRACLGARGWVGGIQTLPDFQSCHLEGSQPALELKRATHPSQDPRPLWPTIIFIKETGLGHTPQKVQSQICKLACNFVTRNFASLSWGSTICEMRPLSICGMKSFLLRLPRSSKKASLAHSKCSINSHDGLLFSLLPPGTAGGFSEGLWKAWLRGLSSDAAPPKRQVTSELSSQARQQALRAATQDRHF